jgi:HTH-type transcriptional regulator/antitoxin HigA
MATRINDIPPPGDFIREELEARDWSQRDLAYVLGVPEQSVNVIVGGKRGISADMAKALGDAFDVPAEFFVNLQTAYDLSRARDPNPSVSKKARLQSSYPVREMIRRGWLVDSDASLLEQQLCEFFDVSDAESIPHMAHAARRTGYEDIPPPQLAWLFRVRQLAKRQVVPTYSKTKLKAAIPKLRKLLGDPDDVATVPRLLSECGVRLVVVESLPGGKIDGVCFWLAKKAPVIGLSLRFDRIDNFWFVLRHEIEHVLQRHGIESPMLDSDIGIASADSLSDEERVANAAASDFCVPDGAMSNWVARKQPFFSEKDLVGFARVQNVHPGIVAGQLRSRINKYSIFARHLVKVRAQVLSTAVADGWGNPYPIS